MTQTISAERIEEMLAALAGPVGAAVIRGDDLADVRTALNLALSALRAQAQGSETVAWEDEEHALHGNSGSGITRSAVAAETWRQQGKVVRPLYATPPAPVDGGVTDEMVMRACQALDPFISLKEMRTALTAALTASRAAVAQDETP